MGFQMSAIIVARIGQLLYPRQQDQGEWYREMDRKAFSIHSKQDLIGYDTNKSKTDH